MNSTPDDHPHYPLEVRGRTQQPVTVYKLLSDHYAVHRRDRNKPPTADALQTLTADQGTVEVFQGTAAQRSRAAASGTLGPVYAQQPGGVLAVPTGQIFIRFKEGIRAAESAPALAQAGYEIAQALDYAPQAAWLRARSGSLSDALTGLTALEAIPDVENVEPQMLLPRANR